jgi:hypothetical protein
LPPITSTTTTTPRPRPPPAGAAGVRPPQTTVRPKPAGLNNLGASPVAANHPKVRLLPYDICGVSTASRIVNGKEAALGQLPWMARLGYETRKY